MKTVTKNEGRYKKKCTKSDYDSPKSYLAAIIGGKTPSYNCGYTN